MIMCKVYAIASQKGGVGKTTTAINLGVELAREGLRVLVIDGDAQGSATASLGYPNPDSLKETLPTVLERIISDESFDKTMGILHHEEGIDLLPCNIELSGIECTLVNAFCRETILSKYINTISEDYDYIVIDCMPSLSLMTINVFAAADRVIIPVQAAYLSLKGLEQLIKTIWKVKNSINSRLGIDGILITMLDSRTTYARDIVSLLDDVYGGAINIYKSKIPFSVRAAEATAEGVSIFKHDPKGKVAEGYLNFAKEVLANG